MLRAFCFILWRMGFSLPSFAKINWTLRVLGKREDNYHELYTVFQTVSLHDTLRFDHADELTLTCDNPAVPVDESNLVLQGARALQERFQFSAGARIGLQKRIPFPGGLGGGSSNAAVTLIGLRQLWGLAASDHELRAIAAAIGSDIPFFLEGGTAIGTGRGDVIEEAEAVSEPYLLIITPDITLPTPEVFAAIGAHTLTKEALQTNLTVCRKDALGWDPRHSELINDLEPAVFRKFPEVERAKNSLLQLGAVRAAMSGSGASVFGIFDKQETRQAAIEALASERSWRKFAVSTVSRDDYSRDVLARA